MKSRGTIFLYAFKVWLAAIIGGSFLATIFMVAQTGTQGAFAFLGFSLMSGFYSLPVLLALCVGFSWFARSIKNGKRQQTMATVFTVFSYVLCTFFFVYRESMDLFSRNIIDIAEKLSVLVAFPLAGGIAAWFMFPESINPLTGKRKNFDILDEF
ncbi:MAG: hypothetical protein RL757_3192 [Bacteroidota bacterium]|jgi:hypothetical protein